MFKSQNKTSKTPLANANGVFLSLIIAEIQVN